MLSVKLGGIKYHFLSVWYDSTWEWTQVSRAISKEYSLSKRLPIGGARIALWNAHGLMQDLNSVHRFCVLWRYSLHYDNHRKYILFLTVLNDVNGELERFIRYNVCKCIDENFMDKQQKMRNAKKKGKRM